MLLNKPPSPVEVYNDVDGELVNLFLVVRDRPEDFVERSKPHCGGAKRKIPFMEIPAEQIIEREEALKTLAGTVEKLQRGGEMKQVEMIRIRGDQRRHPQLLRGLQQLREVRGARRTG